MKKRFTATTIAIGTCIVMAASSLTFAGEDKGTDIISIQEALAEQGFYSGSIDGDYGPMTKAAVEAFYEANGIDMAADNAEDEFFRILYGTGASALRLGFGSDDLSESVPVLNGTVGDIQEDGTEYVSLFDAADAYIHGTLSAGDFTSWCIDNPDDAHAMIPVGDIAGFEQEIADNDVVLIELAAEVLPDVISIEDLIVDTIDGTLYISTAELQAVADESGAYITVRAKDGTETTAGPSADDAEEEGTDGEAAEEEAADAVTYTGQVDALIRGELGREGFDQWCDENPELVHARIPVSQILEFEKETEEQGDILIEMDIADISEDMSVKDLVYEAVSGSYYVSAAKLTEKAAEDGTEVTVQDKNGNSITVDGTGSISSDTGNIVTRDNGETSVEELPSVTPSESATKPAAEQETKPANEPETQPETQPATEPATQPQTQPATQPQTQPATQPQTQPATQPQTQPATQPQTQPATQPQTQPATQPQTQPATQPQTQPATQPAHTHSYSNATCTSPATCSCGATNGGALGHNWTEATCTSASYCTRCGAAGSAATEHNYVQSVTVSATCSAAGYVTYTCTGCGDSYSDTLPATGAHSYEEVAYGYIIHYLPPQYICNLCGFMTTDGDAIGTHCGQDGGSYRVDFYVVDYEECVGEDASYADTWRYQGDRCIYCGTWR